MANAGLRPDEAKYLEHRDGLMEGADIHQIAQNCRTSVEIIEKHYAAHIKTALATSAINIRKERPRAAHQQPRLGRRAKTRDEKRSEAR